MDEISDRRQFDEDEPEDDPRWADVEPAPSKQELRELAHERGRICTNRRCATCAPLRERRHERKVQRKAEARARAHAAGEPCAKRDCSNPVCAEARNTPPTTADPVIEPTGTRPVDRSTGIAEQPVRRVEERHRVGLPCGVEDCPQQICVDGFARERVRRHRRRRPCRSATCENPVCVSARSSS